MGLDLLYVVGGAVLNALILGIWQPWSKAYAGEKGKNRARDEDLVKILAEVRAVTATQKQIEASISNDVWERQWRLGQMRDAYALMLEKLESINIARARARDFLALPSSKDHDIRAKEILQSIEDAQYEYRQARLRAALFVPQLHIQIAYDLLKKLKRLEQEKSSSQAYQEGKTLIESVKADLIAAAHQDLGIARQ